MGSVATAPWNEKKILVINPNSSVSVTDCIRLHLQDTNITAACDYFTGPHTAPQSIDDDRTALQSSIACLPLLVPLLPTYDAFLVACYSDHPLVEELKKLTDAPVMGILEASITQALLLTKRDGKFGIVTTGKQWEPLLTDAVMNFLGTEKSTKFAGVVSTGLGVLDLHEKDQKEVFDTLGKAARKLAVESVQVICLGCAGMSGMKEAILSGVSGVEGSESISGTGNGKIKVVDGVLAGVSFLEFDY